MQHFVLVADATEALLRELRRDDIVAACAAARSTLVQVFAGRVEAEGVAALARRIEAALPGAVVVGATSSGEIGAGQVHVGHLVVSVMCFAQAELLPLALPCEPGQEAATGEAIGRHMAGRAHLQGILLLALPGAMDCAALLAGIERPLPGVTVFGGGAGAAEGDRAPQVFSADGAFHTGAVAVGLLGESLHVDNHLCFGWAGLGPHMSLSEVSGKHIHSIDGHPAIETYRHYLGTHPDEDLFLLEFPLLLERGGHMLARNPISSDAAGGVTMVAEMRQGERVRLGYLDIDTVIEAVRRIDADLQRFSPQAVLLYSCVCRRFALQTEVTLETRPFEHLAPGAGFFTYGEFVRLGAGLELLNSSQVVVALREGAPAAHARTARPAPLSQDDRARTRHLRVTSRLFHFVGALTEELERANGLLRHRAEHDALTGACNRHRLDTVFEMELSRARRHGLSLSLAMLDIDHFKGINDRFGHAVGDRVLKTLVATVEAALRRHDHLFRFGGEEFLVLLPETDLDGATAVAEKLRAAVATHLAHDHGRALPQITVSFGVASYPAHGATSDALLEAVDAALYRAKAEGRNRVAVALTRLTPAGEPPSSSGSGR
jgi:diguanylate cyclase (GGDEF)-like protein